jgi:two-component system sensor histidine kinase YesM
MTSSLRAKMLAMFVLLTAIPLVAVGMITYIKSYQTVSSHSIATTGLVAEQMKRDLDNLFTDYQKFLELRRNPSVLRFLLVQSETYYEAKDILKTFKLYRDTYKFNNGITNIALVNLYGKGISEKKGVFQMDNDPAAIPQFVELSKRPDAFLIVPPQEVQQVSRVDRAEDEADLTVSIVAAVKQEITDELIGYIVINLDASVVEAFCNNTKLGETGFFYIADSKGLPIILPDRLKSDPTFTHPGLQKLQESSGHFKLISDKLNDLVVYTTSEKTGWKIIGEVPLREVFKDANQIENLIILSCISSILFTITLYGFVSSRLIRPIRMLKNKMRQAASGFLDARIHNTGNDEIADLGNSFNIMLDKLKILLENSVKEQEQIKIAELRALQAQINPHFLYNTLDSIVWLAETKKSNEVIQIVNALTKFFRITLSKGRDWITIRDEVEHIRSYLIIQQMRYRDILEFDFHVNEEIMNCLMLKMTLQPIVENALYHGIKNKRGKGCIRIQGDFGPHGTIVFTIADNGAGMTEETENRLRASLERPITEGLPEHTGYGLKNVHQRLRLYYGEPYGIAIRTERGQGTEISVNIPARGELYEKAASR